MSGHQDQDSSILKVAINLTIACFLSGLIIGSVWYFTAEAASEKQILIRNEAMQRLMPDADEFVPVDSDEKVFKAMDKGQTIALLVPASRPGYEAAVVLLVAVSMDGTVIDYEITAQSETPGLGDKGGLEPFRKQFWGKKADQLEVVKNAPDTPYINAMAGATITTKAITNAVKDALADAEEYLRGE